MTAMRQPAGFYQALLRPRSVALVGVSGDFSRVSSRPFKYLRESGWDGRIYPVNPLREMIGDERCYRSLASLPEVPDHVFVTARSEHVVDIVTQCAERDVPVVTVMADGFLATDELGVRLRCALEELAGSGRTRVLGPSSLGVVDVADRLVLTANAAFSESELPHGGLFVASQSGSVIGALVSRGKEIGVGFCSLVSTGNELDLSLGEICDAAVDDPRVTSFALFMEGFTDVAALRRFATRAAAADKPVLAYKVGRSSVAADLSVSHTGALTGDDDVADALLRDLGIARVGMFQTLLEGQSLAISWPHERAPIGAAPRVGIITTTGGGGAMMIDCLAVAGAEVVAPSTETTRTLVTNGIWNGAGALVDLTLAGTRYEVMKQAISILRNAPEFDLVVVVPGSSARFHPELTVKPIIDNARCGGNPVAVFLMPSASDAERSLRNHGIAAFSTPETCADAIMSIVTRHPPTLRGPARVIADGPSWVLDEASSYALFEKVGVPHAPFSVHGIDDDPAVLPTPGEDAPVVVKALASDLPHKSDAGGVVVGVRSTAELIAAIAQITESTTRVRGTRLKQVLVQPLVDGLGEALVGYRHDAQVGPVVVLAAGGILAELYRDRSVRVAPVDMETAREMVLEIRSFQGLSGYRGTPLGDLEALAVTVVAMSRLAEGEDRVLEAEANPVIIRKAGAGVLAVDGLVRVAQAPQDEQS